jgi:CheY-like chemotaxis protein
MDVPTFRSGKVTEVEGWEATRRLKSNLATHDIPIIALSAQVAEAARLLISG